MASIQSPDGGSIDLFYYYANATVHTDANGMQKAQWSDALGRVYLVLEAPSTWSCDWSSTATTTDICTFNTYDPLGNLLNVNQGAQSRNFVYDSGVGNLIAAQNPEIDQSLTCPGTYGSTWTSCYS